MKLAIIFDGDAWHVRRIRLSEHDLTKDEKVYRCDKPISNDHTDGYGAVESAMRWLAAQDQQNVAGDGK